MQNLVKTAKIFSDINRVKIISLLLKEKEVCVCEICDTLELSQPLVSRHLKQMRKENILIAVKKGKWVHYSLTKDPSPLLKCIFNELKNSLIQVPSLIKCRTK